MARKSKAFGELLRQQDSIEQQRKSLKSLAKKVEQGSYGVDKVVVSPPGEAKMSEVLEDFVEPFCQYAETETALRKLYTLAIIAWNMAFLSDAEQAKSIEDILNSDKVLNEDQEVLSEVKDIINALVSRKKQHFPDYTRKIIEFELRDIGTGYHLSVISTLDEVPIGDCDPQEK